MSLIKEFKAGAMQVVVYDTEAAMGKAAAADAAEEILRLQKIRDEINIIFAAAISQNEFPDALSAYQEIDWGKINAFHTDEYCGVPAEDGRSLSGFLCSHFLDRVPVKNRFFLNGACEDPEKECERYGELLRQYPCDLVFLGIGDNGHWRTDLPYPEGYSGHLVSKGSGAGRD